MPTLSREQRAERAKKRRKRHRQRLDQQRDCRRALYARLRANGYVPVTIWAPAHANDAVIARALSLKVPKHRVMTAALTIGLQHLRPSDIMRVLGEWRGFIEAPAANWKKIIERVNRERRKMKEAA